MNDQRDDYVHGHHESVLRTHAWRTVENSAAYLAPHLAPGLSVLDVGSGPGTITIDIARRVSPGRVVGIDASQDVVERARGLAESEGVTNVEFAVGDAYALELADEGVDIVHAHQVLQHVARPVDVLREMHRVLKPGGILAVREVDYGGVMIDPATAALTEWLSIYRAVHRWGGGEPDAGRRVTSWAHEAGFSDIRSTGSLWVFATHAERDWWGSAWAERATESTFATHAIESGHADLETLERIAAGWRAWATADEGWLGMPHGEIIARR
ncbi:methyltransferase domain-containing protein [Agromyces atrinae]|uniref:methyltransferase domain-containing protein n=1 Tax=Agromyces atrinae TaxID=592376 RepID=UPI001F57395F|nr:methyltransferase domain-containing protein [Agromyces atrinae]MCI2958565.1 methyltransferase domain-containing protein [Agromyces atrinae]